MINQTIVVDFTTIHTSEDTTVINQTKLLCCFSSKETLRKSFSIVSEDIASTILMILSSVRDVYSTNVSYVELNVEVSTLDVPSTFVLERNSGKSG